MTEFFTCCRLHIPWTFEQLMTLDVKLLSMIYQNKFTKYVTSVQYPALLNTRFGWPSFVFLTCFMNCTNNL